MSFVEHLAEAIVLWVLAVLLVSFISATAAASPNVYGAPEALEIGAEPKDFNIFASNDTGGEIPLEIKFFGPIGLDANVPAKVPANKTIMIKASLNPKKELSGQSYETTIIAKIGGIERKMQLHLEFLQLPESAWMKDQNKAVDQNKASDQNASAFDLNKIVNIQGLAGLASAQNLELAVDVILVIIVILLIIAFTARLVKRIRQKRKEKEASKSVKEAAAKEKKKVKKK